MIMIAPLMIPTAQIVSMVLPAVGFVLAVVLLSKRARGSFRVTGIIGAALLLLSMISGIVYTWLIDPIVVVGRRNETVLSVLAIEPVVASILTGAGVILFSYAIVAAGRVQKA